MIKRILRRLALVAGLAAVVVIPTTASATTNGGNLYHADLGYPYSSIYPYGVELTGFANSSGNQPIYLFYSDGPVTMKGTHSDSSYVFRAFFYGSGNQFISSTGWHTGSGTAWAPGFTLPAGADRWAFHVVNYRSPSQNDSYVWPRW